MTTRENLALGAVALDGTGDNLRDGGAKINNNFVRIWAWAGGDSDQLSQYIAFDSDKMLFRNTSNVSLVTSLRAINATQNRSISLPNADGTIIVGSDFNTVENLNLVSPLVSDIKISDGVSHSILINIDGPLDSDRIISIPAISSDENIVLANLQQTLENKTLLQPNITSPDITTGINDANGASALKISPAPSSVLNFVLTNASTGNVPTLSVEGADTNVSMNLSAKNWGAISISKGAYQIETTTTSGTISRSRTAIDFNSGTNLNMTLANGSVPGEFKKLLNRGTGAVLVTPTSFANGTSFTINQNEACEVIWNGSSWFISANQSVIAIT